MRCAASTPSTLRGAARALAAVALGLGWSCATEAASDLRPVVVTETPRSPGAPGSGRAAAPAWFERAPGDLGLDFVHAAGADGARATGPELVLFDANNDARLDLYLANGAPSEAQGAMPGPAGRLYIMERERFVDRTVEAGLAVAALAGRALGARAVDYDGDGDWDLLVSFEGQDRLLRNEAGRFTVSADASLARALLESVDEGMPEGSGASGARAMLDANLDGHPDLLTLDGAMAPAEQSAEAAAQRIRPRLYLGIGADSELADATESSGPVFGIAIAGRSLACGDLDGDLDVDVVVTEAGGSAHVWLNQNPSGALPLRCVLLSKAPNTYALGAEVTVTGAAHGGVLSARLGSRYLSQNEHTLTFGLGGARSADVTVHWPDGRTTEHRSLVPGPTHVLH